MRAAVCHDLTADRSGLRIHEDWPEPPPPGAGEVMVEISAAALNFPDLLMLSGGYQFRPDLPFVAGTEGCGRVVAAGDGVGLSVGARVIVSARGGLFAERATVPATSVRAVPAGLDDPEAASFTVGALTAWVGLVDRGRLGAGEHVLVTGAGGGMGLAAVKLAVQRGAEVTAVASQPDRLEAAVAAGAHRAILITREAPVIAAHDVDLVFDPVGGSLTLPALKSLRRGGRYAIIGFAGGHAPSLPLNLPLLGEIEVIGVRAGEQGRQDPAAGANAIRMIDALAAETRPVIGLSVPLAEAAEAYAAMAEARLIGKAVIRP
ncbi:MAG: SDR family NAD(P)-dependent oxidoreductase [Polymorphobacter sp.]|uniref:SDR family NAD(P)-dependent oxidoreductase n=1 Tax=Polymorphobacter sp. TaxID=1909290 RepID=UPI003A83E63F